MPQLINSFPDLVSREESTYTWGPWIARYDDSIIFVLPGNGTIAK